MKNNEEVGVSKAFFLATLSISNAQRSTAFKNKSNLRGTFSRNDKAPLNKTSDDWLVNIRSHI